MKLKGKPLCKLVKDGLIDEDPETFRGLIEAPTHWCRKCGRACNEEKRLCKPERIRA